MLTNSPKRSAGIFSQQSLQVVGLLYPAFPNYSHENDPFETLFNYPSFTKCAEYPFQHTSNGNSINKVIKWK